MDTRANYSDISNNTLVSTGQCGIGISDGIFHLLVNNKVRNVSKEGRFIL